jgi:glycosyltransferase involved in cell wall biosynthesis
MNPPTVTIGVPVYNGQRYVAEAVRGVLAQDYRDLEVVACDNASTDDTPQILAELAAEDSRVRVVTNPTNLGAIPNFNKCVELARGRYFKWQAADDALRPGYLSATVAVLDAEPAVVLAHSQTDVIDCRGGLLSRSPNPFYDWNHWSVSKRFGSAMRDLFCYEIYGLMRKSALDQTLLHAAFRGGDKTLLAEMSLLGPFRRVERPLFLRRVHAEMSGAQTGSEKRHHSGHNLRMPYRLRAVQTYLKIIRRHRLSPLDRLRCLGHVAALAGAYHRWYKLLVPGPSNYFGIDGRGKPDAGTAGEGGLLVKLADPQKLSPPDPKASGEARIQRIPASPTSPTADEPAAVAS